MTDFIWGFLGATAGTLIGVPVLAFVGKAIIGHWLSRDLARFMNKLQLARETELEELRAVWRVLVHRRETRFTNWHDRQATVLAELYGRIIRAEARLRPALPDFQPGPVEDAWKAREELRSYFEENRVFIPEQVDRDVDYALNRLSQVLLRVERGSVGDDEQNIIWDVLGNEIPRVRDSVRQQIQTILSDVESSTPIS